MLLLKTKRREQVPALRYEIDFSAKNAEAIAFPFLFDKSLRVAAASAEVFGCLAASEAFDDCLRAVGVQDGLDVLLKDIAEVDDALAVKTTGHHRAVRKDPELILEPVAEELVALDLGVLVWPLKTVSPLEEDAVADPYPASALYPVTGDMFPQMREGDLVSVAVVSLIPKAEDHDGACLGGFLCYVRKVTHVARVRLVAPLLKAVQGNIDLVHARREDLLSAAGKERAVGGENGLVPALARHPNEFGEPGMRQWLAHEVVVDVRGLIGQLSEDMRKLLLGHAPRRAAVPVTKGAIHVASVCDLDIGFVVHDGSFHGRK